MSFLKLKVWPVVAGFIVASIVMMIFEFINSFLFPLPENLDWADTASVQALTASLPWTAYILVLLGWAIGSFKGGCVTTYLSGEKEYRVTAALSILLVIAGGIDMAMLGHPLVFSVLGTATLLFFPYLGHKYLLRAHAKKTEQSMNS